MVLLDRWWLANDGALHLKLIALAMSANLVVSVWVTQTYLDDVDLWGALQLLHPMG